MTDCNASNSDHSANGTSNSNSSQQPVLVELDGVMYMKVTEGQGNVLFPSSNGVFYNPVQEFNRDFSIAILRVFVQEYKKDTNITNEKKKRRDAYRQSLNSDTLSSKSTIFEPELSTNCDSTDLDNPMDNSYVSPQASPEVPTNSTYKDVTSVQLFDCDPCTTIDSVLETESEDTSGFAVPQPPAGIRYEDGLRVLEALAASGLRSLRYAKEVGGIKEIVANDLSKEAVICMNRNIQYNNMQHLITPSESDASLLLYLNRPPSGAPFDVVDLDPYGSPHLFLDGAVQAVSEGGLLLVTCTDMAVLCGNSPDTCYAKYGATSMKTKACHEMALRIVLQSLESHANRYGRYIQPLVSISADFYIRLAVRVYSGQQRVKESYTKVGLVYHCVGCDTITTQPLGHIEVNGRSVRHRLPRAPTVGETCTQCSSRHQLAGPIWLGPLHDPSFLQQLLESVEDATPHIACNLTTRRRIAGMVHMMLEELPDVPLYHVHDKLCSVVGTQPGRMQRFRSALLNAGYRVSSTHCHKTGLKTDAPAHVVWDVVRAHERTEPAHRMRLKTGAPGHVILNTESSIKVDFSPHPDANPQSRQKVMLRFQVNPERFWGPASRSTSRVLGEAQQQKKLRNQGRNAYKDKVKREAKMEEANAVLDTECHSEVEAAGEGNTKDVDELDLEECSREQGEECDSGDNKRTLLVKRPRLERSM